MIEKMASPHTRQTPRSRSSSFTPTKNNSQKKNSDTKTAAKNLSHVPCKFFRQGTCQAGHSCPFSHSTDVSVDAAACKYFQKGNCKFGLKCALAHIMPDGRRVNPKSAPPPETAIEVPESLSRKSFGEETADLLTKSNPASPFGTSIWSSSSASNSRVSYSNYQYGRPFLRTHSHSTTVPGLFSGDTEVTSESLPNESAILDYDSDDDVIEEDFVPSSLADLLTPQELKRRGSRPSGTFPLARTFDSDLFQMDG